MGGVCCDRMNQGGACFDDNAELIELSAVSTIGLTDRYAIWECGTPFMRTAFWPFRRAVCSAEKACKGKGYVTLDALSCALTTKPWAELRNPSS